jgi:signal transduction histidine kinase
MLPRDDSARHGRHYPEDEVASATASHRSARDVIVAVAALGLTLALLAGGHGDHRGLDPLTAGLAAVASLPLVARRRRPLGVFALTTAASAVIFGLGSPPGPPLGPTIALFYVASDERTRTRLRETAAVVLGMFAVHIAATTASQSGFPTTPILFGVVVWGAAWLVGDQVGQRRVRRDEQAEQLRRAQRDTERERRLAAAEERTRIARDLHDSAAHAINVILVQAGAARLLQERDPGAVRDALSTIEDVARETIGEIDQLVRGLREDGGADAAVEPPTGLAALDTLVARHRAAGIDVSVQVSGSPRPLARGLDQAAYRILQESLTNAARHGEGSAAVAIEYAETGLELDISNPIAGVSPPAQAEGGHGILGMRERTALLGGALDAGHRGGRFRVHARLPYAAREAPA